MWRVLVKDMYKIEMNGMAIISAGTLLIYGFVSLIKDVISSF